MGSTRKAPAKGAGRAAVKGKTAPRAAGAGRTSGAGHVPASRFEAMLLKSAREMRAIHRGEMAPARVDRVPVTARKAVVVPPPVFDKEQVKQIRKGMKVSQPVFASILGVSPSLEKAWERGARTPEGPHARLLEVAKRHPDALLPALATKGKR